MTVVDVLYKDCYPEKHIFEDFADALAYASLAFEKQYVQSISIDYERMLES